jgi:hypothetical protein
MPNQEQSSRGVPSKDREGPSPDVERDSAGSAQGQDYRGDGPAKPGLTSDNQPDLVAPSGVNERDHGAADDKPIAGGAVNLDDDDMAHPRGKTTAAGRTWDEKFASDSGKLGAPNPGLSDRNGPSDPDAKRDR